MDRPIIKLYIACHKKSTLPPQGIFVPIQLGALQAYERFPDMLHDDTGENISEKRVQYCELTAQYWAWKNDNADYYGLCHYRRYFSFLQDKLPEDIHATVKCDRLNESTLRALSLDDEKLIRSRIEPYDIILTSPDNFARHRMKDLYAQYASMPDLHVEDLHLAIKVLKEMYPKFSGAADRYMKNTVFYPCNMFIMKKTLFEDYSRWLFSILFELEKRIDMENYSAEGTRTLAHIGERLLGIFFTYIKENHSELKSCVLQRAIILKTKPLELPSPFFPEKCVSVFFSCTDYFVPYFSALLRSLLDHVDDTHNYDLLMLHTDIQPRSQTLLKGMIKKNNVSLRFIDISVMTENRRLRKKEHMAVQSYYRLLVGTVLKAYDKILWLDSDMIVKKNVAELFDTEIGDCLLGAVIDPDIAGQYCIDIWSKEYLDRELKLQEPFQYFQAGVLLVNVREFRKAFHYNELLDYAEENIFRYMDQDVLNIKCAGRVCFLNPKWNVLSDNAGQRISEIVCHAPKRIFDAYMESRSDPYIIHYAGDCKPWLDPSGDFASEFWKVAQRSPFFGQIIQKQRKGAVDNRRLRNSFFGRTMDKLLPKGSRRRTFAKKVFNIMFQNVL